METQMTLNGQSKKNNTEGIKLLTSNYISKAIAVKTAWY
jgi:hypothetical protein